ncbi:MAG: Slp family lipoprotein [Nitrospira sp.]|nr:Slp family lipoprotein [Nitrospira sp.]
MPHQTSGRRSAVRHTSDQLCAGEVDPRIHRGQSVTFGGKSWEHGGSRKGPRIEILQLPLTSSLQPTMDVSRSEGRFVALQEIFPRSATIHGHLPHRNGRAGRYHRAYRWTKPVYLPSHPHHQSACVDRERSGAPRIRRPIALVPIGDTPTGLRTGSPWPYYW